MASICQNAAKEDRFDGFEWKRPEKLALLTNDDAEVDFDLDSVKPEDIETMFDDQMNTLGNYAFISAISALA